MRSSIQESIAAIHEEVSRWKRQGTRALFLRPETLTALRQALGEATPSEAAPPPASARGNPSSGPVESSQGRPAPETTAPTPAEGDSPAPAPTRRPPVPRRKSADGSSPEAAPLPPPEAVPLPDPPALTLPEGSRQERWEWLRQRVLGDPVCTAHVRPGKQVVFGVGNIEAEIFFCGEAPGADEEEQGEPFVGRAGQLLTRIIQAMGLQRSDVYIGNIMNWRPEMPTPAGNRPPTPAEMAYCLPFLRAQVEIVAPKVIVALGNTAVTGLLGPDPNRRIGQVRGHWLEFGHTPLMITYHPSYILRSGTLRAKRTIWEDMLAVMERVGMPVSEKQRRYFTEN